MMMLTMITVTYPETHDRKFVNVLKTCELSDMLLYNDIACYACAKGITLCLFICV